MSIKYPVGVKDPIIREWMAQWVKEWETYAPRPVEVFGASVIGEGPEIQVTSASLVDVGDPVVVPVPDGAEVVITLQGRLRLASESGSVSCTFEISRNDTKVSRDIARQPIATPNNMFPIHRTIVSRGVAGVDTYRLEAGVLTGTTADFIGLQWQVEIRPAKPRTFDRG